MVEMAEKAVGMKMNELCGWCDNVLLLHKQLQAQTNDWCQKNNENVIIRYHICSC